MTDSQARTHNALVKRFLTKKFYVWLEVGEGRKDSDGGFHAFLDRMPIGGFTGYVYFSPKDRPPPAPEPERPDDPADAQREEV